MRNFLKLYYSIHRLFKYVPSVSIVKVDTYEKYKAFSLRQEDRYRTIGEIEKALLPCSENDFSVDGICFVCRRIVSFRADFKFSWEPGLPNWRESLECPVCGLNNRMRATIQLFRQECRPSRSSKIFITEQFSPLYSWLSRYYRCVIGSEFLGEAIPHGSFNDKGIRNEDLTNLSFGDLEFDFILSFDVLEHVPDYQKALRECYRCLKPRGVLYFSVPFLRHSNEHLVRAHVDESGKIIHFLSPEYHGDPLHVDGILSFRQFGWKLLDELRETGFSKASALLYWSRPLGYLGGEQVLFKAQRKQ